MNKRTKNIVLGALSSLALALTPALAAEDEKPKGGILTDPQSEIKSGVKAQLEKAGLPDDITKELLKQLEGVDLPEAGAGKSKTKVITRTMVMGADGKLRTVNGEEGEAGVLGGLAELLSDTEDADVKKLLQENEGAIASGKVVIIDEEGNRTEKELGEFSSINDLIKDAMKGAQGESTEDQKRDAAMERLLKESAEQRLLLNKILKKLEEK